MGRLCSSDLEQGAAVPRPPDHPADQFGKLAPYRAFLLEIAQAEPNIMPKELAAALALCCCHRVCRGG